jgi:hypothetical protein
MNIGKEQPAITVEPLEDPFRTEAPAPVSEPERESQTTPAEEPAPA